MDILLPPDLHGQADFTNRLLPDEPRLRYAETIVAAGPFGRICLQKVRSDTFMLAQKNLHLRQPASLTLMSHQSRIAFGYVLRGQALCELKGLGCTDLKEGYYHLYYIPRGAHDIRFEAGVYNMLFIELQPGLLSMIAAKYPALNALSERIAEQSAAAFRQPGVRMTSEVRELLTAILQCDLAEPERGLFLVSQMNRLLLAYLKDMDGLEPAGSRYKFSEDDWRNLDELASIPHDEQGTESEISRRLLMSERKLREGFKQRHKTGRKKWNHQQKLKEAIHLLTTTTLKVCQVAARVGYKSLSSFGAMFLKAMGTTPAKFRKK